MLVSLTERKEAALRNIEIGCLAAVMAGGETWQEYMRNAEKQMNMDWEDILALMNARYHEKRSNRAPAA